MRWPWVVPVAIALGACVPTDHARLDDYGRIAQMSSSEVCITPEGKLRENGDPPRLCGDGGVKWEPFEVGDCVHLYVRDPYGEVEDVRQSTRCSTD